MVKAYWNVFIIILLLCSMPYVLATTLQGSIYNENLALEKDVLLEINSTPAQKFLAKEGTYSFSIPPGKYSLIARKGTTHVEETIDVVQEGTFVFDVFLIPDLMDEEELWGDTEVDPIVDTTTTSTTTRFWPYVILIIILAGLLARIIYMRKKYGSVVMFRRRIKAESTKTIEQHKEDLASQPQYLDDALAIIKKNDGRISQKDLRKEMAYLSEAKISLIITELEHKGLVEKVKKGRGNVVLLKRISESLKEK